MHRTMFKLTRATLLAYALLSITIASLSFGDILEIWFSGGISSAGFAGLAVSAIRVILVALVSVLAFYWIPEILRRLFPEIAKNDLTDGGA